MNSLRLLKPAFAACLLSPLPAASVTLVGQLDLFPPPPAPNARVFSTIDYIEFYVDQTTQVTLSGRLTGGAGLISVSIWTAFLGVSQFETGIAAIVLFPDHTVGSPAAVNLEPGRYFISMDQSESNWDRFAGLVPTIDTDPAPFQQNYEVTLTGGMRLVAFYEGQTDNTFKITVLPEPGTAILCAFGALLPSHRRRYGRSRGK